MNNNLMRDETRERFENTQFPDHLTPAYLGRFNDESSLGRYAMGYAPTNLPIKITSLEVEPIRFGDVFGDQMSESNRIQVMAHDFKTTFEFEEPIAGYQLVYLFFGVWGDKTASYARDVYMDFQDTLEISTKIAYDFLDDEINHHVKNVVERQLTDFRPTDFHICVYGITQCRTTDGRMYSASEQEMLETLRYAIPCDLFHKETPPAS